MAKEKRSVLDAIKQEISRADTSGFKKFFRIRESGAKVRVRFLDDFEECAQIVFHDKWNGFNHPCLVQFGKDCPNCDNPEARTSTQYCWNVYNYETKKPELFMYKANKATPIYSLMSIYEIVGDITQQDIVITRNGTGVSTTYQCTAVPKQVAFDKEVETLSEQEILDLCLETFDRVEDESKKSDEIIDTMTTNSKRIEDDEDDDNFDEDDFDFDDEDELPQRKKGK